MWVDVLEHVHVLLEHLVQHREILLNVLVLPFLRVVDEARAEEKEGKIRTLRPCDEERERERERAYLLRETSSELDHAGLDHLFVVLALAQNVLLLTAARADVG